MIDEFKVLMDVLAWMNMLEWNQRVFSKLRSSGDKKFIPRRFRKNEYEHLYKA